MVVDVNLFDGRGGVARDGEGRRGCRGQGGGGNNGNGLEAGVTVSAANRSARGGVHTM